MTTAYHPLPTTTLAAGAEFNHPPHQLPQTITLDMPAIYAMTDLEQVAAITIEVGASAPAAEQKMHANDVRLLLVVSHVNEVLGLLTATDLLGEKPMLMAQRMGGNIAALTVGNLMTPRTQLEVIQMVDVNNARVGDIVQSLKQQSRQHALVVEFNEQTLTESVRGIFSSTRIGRQLGIKVETTGKATTFAELKHALFT